MAKIIAKPTPKISISPEKLRIDSIRAGEKGWRTWGPYLSERQWGTVREDYSPDGAAWDSFPHDMARSRAYRWGEDGIAGFSDEKQLLCMGLAVWNGVDPILKERLFGLTNSEGNHGEDVKELYYYLDATPTHSYMKMLYKYPQAEFPYSRLVGENQWQGAAGPEHELIDTNVFEDDRYFDVVVEYAKESPTDILMSVTAHNRGPDLATIHLLPQVWFRNTWSWQQDSPKPVLKAMKGEYISAKHSDLGDYRIYADGNPELLFCDNETNTRRLYGQNDAQVYFKDAFHEYVIENTSDAVNPEKIGTKAAAYYRLDVPAGGSPTVHIRLTKASIKKPFHKFSEVVKKRRDEADVFYAQLQHDIRSEDERNVQRQALAGLIWSKQFYNIDIPAWLKGDETQPPPPDGRDRGRNHEWTHLNNADIISMPDKWEYPWYAAWDLAFHCVPFALIDSEFAKDQLLLLTREWYMHPNGQLPAYEWNFSDVNPPVHAWATWRVFQMDRKQRGDAGDLEFLEKVFHKLMLNFTWWVNRKDEEGLNIFQGGFLGLDNIGVFDRSAELPTGGHIHQSDGTSWMAMYCLNLMRIALELARHNRVYEDIATKFFEHFLHIAEAMTNMAGENIGLWDDEDEFYYDMLHLPNGEDITLKVRSMVGLIPLFAVETLDEGLLDELPEFKARLEWYLAYRPELTALVSHWQEPGQGDRRLLSLLRGDRMKAVLKRMLDETEFLSDYGIRALSRAHANEPYQLHVDGQTYEVGYRPAESDNGLFGGNSNWRGPIWFPVNHLIIESLQKFHHYYGDDFKIECPTGSGNEMNLEEVSQELSNRLTRIFLQDKDGRRPVYGKNDKLQIDPHFNNHILFHEYFHGDSGRGVGASHQTGWTALVAKLIQPRQAEDGHEINNQKVEASL